MKFSQKEKEYIMMCMAEIGADGTVMSDNQYEHMMTKLRKWVQA